MITRKRGRVELQEAKVTLKKRGWSYRKAAPHLGVCFTHLALVLTGRRISRRLLKKIAEIPARIPENEKTVAMRDYIKRHGGNGAAK